MMLSNVSIAELLDELRRRNDYLLRGWQESYTSANYWRARAVAAEKRNED